MHYPCRLTGILLPILLLYIQGSQGAYSHVREHAPLSKLAPPFVKSWSRHTLHLKIRRGRHVLADNATSSDGAQSPSQKSEAAAIAQDHPDGVAAAPAQDHPDGVVAAPAQDYPESVDVFSALHDTVNGEVRIFTVVHPPEMCESIRFCRYSAEGVEDNEVAATTIRPFEIPGYKVDCYISCRLDLQKAREDPGIDKVTLLDTEKRTLNTPAQIETLRVAGIGFKGVGMCVGPIYTYIPQFLDWLTYWAKFDVTGVHAYVPLYNETERYDEMGQGQPYRRPLLFMHHLLSWTTYQPFERAEYHGQRLAYNDCIYRHRHLHDYIVMMDVDEFLHFPNSTSPPQLSTWLNRMTPDDAAGACMQEYETPPVRCYHHFNRAINVPSKQPETEEVGHYSVRYSGLKRFRNSTGPLPEPDLLAPCTDPSVCRYKCIIRPLAVRAYNVHDLQVLEEGWQLTHLLPAERAVFKHMRCQGGPTWD